MTRSTLRQAGRGTARQRVAAGMLALAVGTTTAVVGLAAPASAAPVDDAGGSLAWGIKSSLRNYVGTQLAAIAGTIGTPGMGGGAAPIGTRIVPFGGASFDPASTSASGGAAAPETKAYLFPVAGGDVTDEDNLTIDFDGGVQYWFPSHVFDIRFSDLALVIDDGVAEIRGDISVAIPVNWDGVAAGTGWTAPAADVADDVAIATVDAAAVTIDGDAVSVSATGVKFTAAAAEAFTVPAGALGPDPVNLYNAGDAIDDFTVTATLAEETSEPVFEPAISVDKSLINANGDTITITGSGFDPTLLGNGAPVSNLPAGFYVVVGSFADQWKISEGVASTVGGVATRPNVVQKWALPEPPLNSTPALSGSSYTRLNADGSFQVSIAIPGFDPASLVNGTANFGIYTYPAGTRTGAGTSWTLTPADWAARAPFETYTPLTIGTAVDGTQTITAEVVHSAGGELTWTIPDNDPVALGSFVNHGAYLESTGEINPVTVTDTRSYQANAWSLTGRLGDFSGGGSTIDGKYLGWAPKVTSAGAGATAGAAIASGWVSGNGLKGGGSLGAAADGHIGGSGSLGADLTLQVPVETPAGSYSATLTLTLLG
ncbi:MAG: HtaA domain-containing protein [Microbacteriaceae bacterium]|nr:HtaA domain-containing protein [Microbacteriaceae bacterium]